MSAKDLKLKADARERMLREVDVLIEAAKKSCDAELDAVEATQFERGYN